MLDVDEGNLYKFVIEDDGVVVVADSAGSVAVAGVIGDVSIVRLAFGDVLNFSGCNCRWIALS